MPLLGGVGYEVVSGLLLSSLLVYRARRRRRRRRRPSALMPHPPPTLADAAGLGAAGEDGFRTTLTCSCCQMTPTRPEMSMVAPS